MTRLPDRGFFRPEALSTPMASAAPRDIRPSSGMNRWTLEPLLLGLAWIMTLAPILLGIVFVWAGLGTVFAVVAVFLLWAAVAVLWSRRRGTRHSP